MAHKNFFEIIVALLAHVGENALKNWPFIFIPCWFGVMAIAVNMGIKVDGLWLLPLAICALLMGLRNKKKR